MSRQRRKSHEPSLESLESRRLLSLARQPALAIRSLQAARRAFHEQRITSRPDLDDFARQLALHLLTMNMMTGGHDAVGRLVVSDDGRTMTSTGPIVLAHAPADALAAEATTLGRPRAID